MINLLRRFILRYKWMREYEKSLDRRVDVENYLKDCSAGKKPLPDKDKCKQLAVKLGVPDKWRAK